MTPQELKNSILQLAIQGKLVEQRPEEGTGDELYKRIQAEKQKLIKDGKLKKEKPLPEIAEDEIPFEIPENWKWARIGDVFKIEMGQSPDGKSVSEIGDGIEFHQGKVYFGDKYLQKSPQITNAPTKIASPSSVLLCVRAPVGKVNITDRKICIGRGLCAVSPLSGMAADFTYYLLATYENIFIKQATGTTFVAITAQVVKNQPIPLPPLGEQKRIVAKIEELLPLVERYGEAWTKLEEFNKKFPDDMKKSILQQAIQGKLVEQKKDEYADVSKINKKKNSSIETLEYEIPANWTVGTIESICELVPTKQYQILENQVMPTGKFPVISQSKEYQIGFSDEESKLYHVTEPLVAFGDHTTVVKYIDFDFIVGADGLKLFKPKEIISYKYLYYALQFLTCGLAKVGGYSRHYKFFKNKPIPIPPLAEQKRIVAKIEELLPLCETLK